MRFARVTKNAEYLGKPVQSREIDVAPVHHVERARFDRQMVQNGDIVNFPVGNRHKSGNVAAQIQQRVPLHGSLAPSKLGSRKQRHAQVDGRRVERIHRLFEHHGPRIAAYNRRA